MEKAIQNILMPTDFSDCAKNALDTAIGVATKHGAKLTLLHVVQPIPELYGLERDNATRGQQKELLDQQEEKITVLADGLRALHGLQVSPLIVIGQTIASICEAAKDLETDLVIMGTHGIRGFREFLMGSNTYGVNEKCIVPVLSVPLAWKGTGFAKIMFPVRNIPNSLEKYMFLKNFVDTSKSKLVVYGIYKIDDETLEQAYRKISAFARDISDEWKQIKKTSIITDENLADEVIERSVEMNCDLIVITARVGKSISEFFMGKFAQQMVNHSPLPVLHIK